MTRILNPNAVSKAAAAATSTGYNPVVLTGTDAFSAGDPVFSNSATGEIINLNQCDATLALAAGSSAAVVSSTSPQTSTGGTLVSGVLDLGDGTYVVASQENVSGTARYAEIRRFNSQGVLLASAPLLVGGGSASAYNYIVLTNLVGGNIGVVVSDNSGGGALGAWFILTPGLSILYSSTGTANLGTNILWIQPTSDGGFLCQGNGGAGTGSQITKVSGAGTNGSVLSNRDNGNVGAGTSGDDATNLALSSSGGAGEFHQAMIPISSGGFGLITTNGSTTVYYNQFNSDGSIRNSETTLVTSGGSGSVPGCYWARSSTGNIFWVVSFQNATYWGIVGDNGTIVKAATAYTADSATSNQVLRATVNSAGDFFWAYSLSGGLGLHYVSNTGTAKSGWPKNIGGTLSKVKLVPLSTGVAVVYKGSTYTQSALFYDNSGNQVLNTDIVNFGGGNTGTSGLTVYGDAVYGVVNGDYASAITDQVVFKITNAGVLSRGLYPGKGGVSGTSQPVIFADANSVRVYSSQSGSTPGWSVRHYRISDLNSKYSYVGGQAAGSSMGSTPFKVKEFGKYSIVFSNNSVLPHFTSGSNMIVAQRLKPAPTTLIGVAATSSSAGSQITVNTKGPQATNWVGSVQFDQSGATPSGNKGSLSGSFMNLSGL